MGRRSERGVTLPELLVVLAIIGLFALITIPAFRDFLNAFAVKTAAMQVRDVSRLSRQMAVARKSTVDSQLVQTAGSEGYKAWQEKDAPNDWAKESDEDMVRPLVTIPKGVNVKWVKANGDRTLGGDIYFRFNSDGTIGRKDGAADESQWCILLEKKINNNRTDRWMIVFKLSGKTSIRYKVSPTFDCNS